MHRANDGKSPCGYMRDEKINEYVTRIRDAALFGSVDPNGKSIRPIRKKRPRVQKLADARREIKSICEEWRDRAWEDCSYELYKEDYWNKTIKKNIRDNARRLITGINHVTFDGSSVLDKEIRHICVICFEDLPNTIEYCPNRVFIEPKDIYDSLWKCRDFELKHLWQRSIFLSAFLVMCFTGYGAVLLKMFKYAQSCNNLLTGLNFVEMSIAFIGVVLSVMWIMMGKGSKAWYEQYEQSIYAIENDPKYSVRTVVEDMHKDKVMHGSLHDPPKVSNCLFNTNAGKYSVSKINIGIGQLSFGIWILLLVAHIVLFTGGLLQSKCPFSALFPGTLSIWAKWVLGIISVGFAICMILNCIWGFRSSIIKPNEKKKARKELRSYKKTVRKEKRKHKMLIVLGDEGSAGNEAEAMKIQMRRDNEVSFDFKKTSWIKILQRIRILNISVSDNDTKRREDFDICQRRFFNRLKCVDTIVVRGLSFSDKQLPYLSVIVRMTGRNKLWIIVCDGANKNGDEMLTEEMKAFKGSKGLTNFVPVPYTEFESDKPADGENHARRTCVFRSRKQKKKAAQHEL